MDNLSIYNQVRKVPSEAQKEIRGGRIGGFTDINPMWRIQTLTELFGPCGFGWYYDIEKEWMEHTDKDVAAFVDICGDPHEQAPLEVSWPHDQAIQVRPERKAGGDYRCIHLYKAAQVWLPW